MSAVAVLAVGLFATSASAHHVETGDVPDPSGPYDERFNLMDVEQYGVYEPQVNLLCDAPGPVGQAIARGSSEYSRGLGVTITSDSSELIATAEFVAPMRGPSLPVPFDAVYGVPIGSGQVMVLEHSANEYYSFIDHYYISRSGQQPAYSCWYGGSGWMPSGFARIAYVTGPEYPISSELEHLCRSVMTDRFENVEQLMSENNPWGSSCPYEFSVPSSWALEFGAPMHARGSAKSSAVEVKNGRVLPVKVRIFRDRFEQDSDAETGPFTIKVSGTTCADTGQAVVDPVRDHASAGKREARSNGFRWSETGGFWIYNLDTKALGLTSGGCYRIDVYADGDLISAEHELVIKATR